VCAREAPDISEKGSRTRGRRFDYYRVTCYFAYTHTRFARGFGVSGKQILAISQNDLQFLAGHGILFRSVNDRR